MLENIKRNILGTTSFDLKIKGMRKSQDFIVYPITQKTDKILIQSDTRWGEVNVRTGEGVMSKSHQNGANSMSFMLDGMRGNLTDFQLSEDELNDLNQHIRFTSGDLVGDSFVKSDNSGAILI